MRVKQCFNSTIKKSNGNRPTSSKQRTTTCLLCGNVVNLPLFIEENNKMLKKLVTNLCKHLKIAASLLPVRYTEETFPFCSITCKPLLIRLLEQQTVLEDAFHKIETMITIIQQKVADLTIIENVTTSSAMPSNAKLKFMKLKDLILEGYKNKLSNNCDILDENHQVNKKVQEKTSMIVLNKIDDNEYCQHDERDKLHEDYEDDSIQLMRPLYTVEEKISSDNKYSTGTENPDTLFSCQSETDEACEVHNHEDAHYDPTLFEEKFSWSVADPNFSVQEFPVVIAHENEETFEVILTDTKQEIYDTVAHGNDDDDVDESNDIYALETKKRRFLYEGVEIYRLNGTGKNSNRSFLQCSLCSYTHPIPKSSSVKISSAFVSLKTHILHVHKKKLGLPKPYRPPVIACIPCNRKFSNMKDLRKHNAQHPDDLRLVCDICGKPMKKGTPSINLDLHKFSHKNAMERRAAILAGERGAYNRRRKSKSVMNVTQTTNPEKRRQNKSNNSEMKRLSQKVGVDSGDEQFDCIICSRKFGRKCHLAWHLSTHRHLQTSSSI